MSQVATANFSSFVNELLDEFSNRQRLRRAFTGTPEEVRAYPDQLALKQSEQRAKQELAICLSLTCVGTAAQLLGLSFASMLPKVAAKSRMMKRSAVTCQVLFALVELRGSTCTQVADSAWVALQCVARACGHSNPSGLLGSNSSYLVDKIAFRLKVGVSYHEPHGQTFGGSMAECSDRV